MTEPRYGVLADLHQLRTGDGVPTMWDGWYSDRAMAEEVLTAWKKRWPRAHVSLVVQLG